MRPLAFLRAPWPAGLATIRRGGALASMGLSLTALLGSGVANAENRFQLRSSYYVEPASGQRLHVFVPEVAIEGDPHRAVTLKAGYLTDVVTGATPRTYRGAGSAVDAISSATRLTEVRHEARAGIELRAGPATLETTYRFATESDYRSHVLDVGARVDLWGRNTTLRLGYTRNFDSVCSADNRGLGVLDRRPLPSSAGCFDGAGRGLILDSLAIDAYSAGWTQVLSRLVILDVGLGLQILEGLQSNPYRRVSLFGGVVEPAESHPRLRQRLYAQARLKIALPRARAALGLHGRYYRDTWGVQSGTGEVTWDQQLSSWLLLRVRARVYQQTRAVFYRDAGEERSYEAVGPAGQYFTGDRELSPFRDWLVGARLGWARSADHRGKVWRRLEAVDLHLRLDVLAFDALTPAPPNKARTDGVIDALLVAAGLALRW